MARRTGGVLVSGGSAAKPARASQQSSVPVRERKQCHPPSFFWWRTSQSIAAPVRGTIEELPQDAETDARIRVGLQEPIPESAADRHSRGETRPAYLFPAPWRGTSRPGAIESYGPSHLDSCPALAQPGQSG